MFYRVFVSISKTIRCECFIVQEPNEFYRFSVLITLEIIKVTGTGFAVYRAANFIFIVFSYENSTMPEKQEPFHFSPLTLAFPLYFVLFLWVVFWFEVTYGFNFNKYGIYPRTLKGLRGILFSPFIHGDIKHLYQNSIPLFVLMFSLFYFYRSIAFKVLIYGTLFTGMVTWIIGRPSHHIGASGIIYFLFSFIFFSGIIRRYYRLIAVSLLVIFLYGSIVWFMLPVKDEISWEGHLAGFISGMFFAYFYKSIGPQREAFHWETDDYEPDDFDRMFDENGNLIRESSPDEEMGEKDSETP